MQHNGREPKRRYRSRQLPMARCGMVGPHPLAGLQGAQRHPAWRQADAASCPLPPEPSNQRAAEDRSSLATGEVSRIKQLFRHVSRPAFSANGKAPNYTTLRWWLSAGITPREDLARGCLADSVSRFPRCQQALSYANPCGPTLCRPWKRLAFDRLVVHFATCVSGESR